MRSLESMIKEVTRALKEENLAQKGDMVIMIAGSPISVKGQTDLLKLHELN